MSTGRANNNTTKQQNGHQSSLINHQQTNYHRPCHSLFPQARCSHLHTTFLGRSFELPLHFFFEFHTSPLKLLFIMQYTSKLALLAVALFSSSVVAFPVAMNTELEVRDADNELTAREVFDAYLQARDDPTLSARDLKSLELDAREYLEYLEAREAATSTEHSTANPPTHSGTPQTSQTPLSADSSSKSSEHGHYLARVQNDRAAAAKAASEEFQDPTAYKKALADPANEHHKFAVRKFLHKAGNMKEALADKTSMFHKAAVRINHQQKATTYLSQEKNYMRALKSKHNKFHKDAVKQYLSADPERFENALMNKKAHFHKDAVHMYLHDSSVRKEAIADEHSAFHSAAVKMQKKINHSMLHGKHSKGASDATPSHTSTSESAPSATSTHAA